MKRKWFDKRERLKAKQSYKMGKVKNKPEGKRQKHGGLTRRERLKTKQTNERGKVKNKVVLQEGKVKNTGVLQEVKG